MRLNRKDFLRLIKVGDIKIVINDSIYDLFESRMVYTFAFNDDGDYFCFKTACWECALAMNEKLNELKITINKNDRSRTSKE